MGKGGAMSRSFGGYDRVVEEAIQKSFLAEFPRELQDMVLSDALLANYPANSIIYREYEPARIAIVLTGLIRAYLTSKEGRQITVKYGGSGELIGTPALVGGPIPVCVQVVRDSTVLVINPAVVEELGKKEPRLGWRVAEEIGDDFCDLLIILGENVFDSVQVRTARHLLYLAVPSGENGELVATLTQRELADAVGSVREVVSRILHSFQSEGLIAIKPEGIVILDIGRLKTITRNSQR
jgi:CRP/FNR family transcriptional regulator, cyclic AMP receptor protein